jgi:hypothetical protein
MEQYGVVVAVVVAEAQALPAAILQEAQADLVQLRLSVVHLWSMQVVVVAVRGIRAAQALVGPE